MITGRSFATKNARVVNNSNWFYERYHIDPAKVLGCWDMRDKQSKAFGTTWTDISGNGNDLTLVNSPTINSKSLTLAVNQYCTEPEVDDETGVTFWPTYPGLTTTATAAKIRVAGVDLAALYATESGDSAYRVVLWDSTPTLIGYGYIRGADSALALGAEKLTNGDCSADSFTGEGQWTHDAGNEEYDTNGTQVADSELYQMIAMVKGATYKVVFTVKNWGAGTIWARIGASSSVTRNSDGTYTDYIVNTDATGAISIGVECDSDFSGSVDDISIKPVTAFGTDGVLINSTLAGGTQTWTGTGKGDPNDPKYLEVYKVIGDLTGDQTHSIIVKLDDGRPAAAQCLFAKDSNAAGTVSLYAAVETTGKVTLYASEDGTNYESITTDDAVFADGAQTVFTNLTFVLDKTAGTGAIYVNGAAVATTEDITTGALLDTYAPLMIGSLNGASFIKSKIGMYGVVLDTLTAIEAENIHKANPVASFE